MTGPKPYGLHVISGELTDKDLDRIASVIHRFLTFKDAAELQNIKQVYDLPDGGYFIIQDMGGIFKVLADKQVESASKIVRDGLVKTYIPMFFSGVITRAVLRSGQKVGIRFTEQCRFRLRNALGRDLDKNQSLDRFTIEANQKFPEFASNELNVTTPTQYAGQNPGWYSGSMAKVMQFVGGYGRQDFENLPDSPIERATIALPDGLSKSLWLKYKMVRLPGYDGIPPTDGAFRYDYKWRKTHAVAFDNQNKPWLIEVGTKVWAMPLPIIPLTADPLFREYVEKELNDSEILEVLDTFGAMPSGECFPENREDFNAWVRAGAIIEVCEVRDFHNKIGFYDGCGWSFNTKGNNAYNTAYHYDETTGLIYSSTFKLNLSLSGVDTHYGIGEVQLKDSPLGDDDKKLIGEYVGKLNGAVAKGTPRANALLFKLRRVDQQDLLQRAKSQRLDIASEVDYWDRFEVTPLASHGGNVNRVYGGYLYHPAQYEFQPQIKFPDYQLGFCKSFDFTPVQRGWVVACDTIMFAYYEGDNLKVIKYFYEGTSYYKEVDTDFESPMIVGKWYQNSTIGLTSIHGYFYTSDLDKRSEISPKVVQTTIEGRDAGYDSQPFFSYDSFFWRPGTLWRNRYYTHLTKTTTTEGHGVDMAVLIPMFQRASSLYAFKEWYQTKTYNEGLSLYSITDPYTYRYWTHDPIWAWIGGLEVMKGSPSPTQGDPVWAEMELYNPSQTNDFADNGPWISGLPADFTWLIHPNKNEWKHAGGGGAPKVKTYSTSYKIPPKEDDGELHWSTIDPMQVSEKRPNDRYFLPSPDRYGFTMYREGCKVFMGQIIYANISEQDEQKEPGTRKVYGHCSLVDNKSNYHFIGVINE